MKDGKPWVGDQVHDEATNRKAIVTDVRGGTVYVLRHVWGGGDPWEAEDPETLTVTEPAGGGQHHAQAPEAVSAGARHCTPNQEGPPSMGRTEYYNDPNAPKANTLIPASNLLVVDDAGAILLQRRRDTGQWALPGGAQDIGETAAECALRECLEETGITAEITGFLGVYTNPRHIVAYTDGEIRQQYENTYIGRPVAGEPTINDEADGVCFVQPADLDQYDIHPSMRQQIGDYLVGTYPYLG